MRRWLLSLALGLAGMFCLSFGPGSSAAEKTAAERGREALLGRSFSPPIVSVKAYDELWKQWGLKEKPADYDQAFRDRYGVQAAPYANQGRPMGFRESWGMLTKGITNDCMLCHAGSAAGQSQIGIPNSSLDLQGLYEDLFAAAGFSGDPPFPFSNVRGTIEATAAVSYLMQFRDADLNVRLPVKYDFRADLCEDTPAWWLLKKKKTMYHTGGADARSVRSLMSFMLSPLQSGPYIKKHEPDFVEIRAYLLTIEPPKYPFAIDTGLAAKGKDVFEQNCAKCHGTYGPQGSYPNKIVPLEKIGTDPNLARAGLTAAKAGEHYLHSWMAQEKGPDGEPYVKLHLGYQAPPLDGIWATAPYFHNGSVPTVYQVLNSKARPKIFTRSYRTDKEAYDPIKVGWKVQVLDKGADQQLPSRERRKIYDTTQSGRANTGHPFGDKLSEAERMAVIEYLKTL